MITSVTKQNKTTITLQLLFICSEFKVELMLKRPLLEHYVNDITTCTGCYAFIKPKFSSCCSGYLYLIVFFNGLVNRTSIVAGCINGLAKLGDFTAVSIFSDGFE